MSSSYARARPEICKTPKTWTERGKEARAVLGDLGLALIAPALLLRRALFLDLESGREQGLDLLLSAQLFTKLHDIPRSIVGKFFGVSDLYAAEQRDNELFFLFAQLVEKQ